MPEVKCTVSNCNYWAHGNMCSADQILITAGSPRGKSADGSEASEMRETPVPISEDTYCLTFQARETPSRMTTRNENGGFMDAEEEPEKIPAEAYAPFI